MSVMNQIIFDVQSLFNVKTNLLHKNVKTILQNHEVSEDKIRVVLSDLERSASVQIFEGLETQHNQQSYFNAHFKFVVSLMTCL